MVNKHKHYKVTLSTDVGTFEYQGIVALSSDFAVSKALNMLREEFSVLSRPSVSKATARLTESPMRVPAP